MQHVYDNDDAFSEEVLRLSESILRGATLKRRLKLLTREQLSVVVTYLRKVSRFGQSSIVSQAAAELPRLSCAAHRVVAGLRSASVSWNHFGRLPRNLELHANF